jgi:hypothetical protein
MYIRVILSCLATLDGPSNNFKCILTCKVEEVFESFRWTGEDIRADKNNFITSTKRRKKEAILK